MTGNTIGVDLDGVICALNEGELRSIDNIEDPDISKEFERDYYANRPIKQNPYMFKNPKDDLVVITARPAFAEDVTNEWMREYFPGIPTRVVSPSHYTEKQEEEWINEVVNLKYNEIKRQGVDIYVDDNPAVVAGLREKGVSVLQYGGRWE